MPVTRSAQAVLCAASIFSIAAASELRIDRKPFSMGTGIEMGQIVEGKVQDKNLPINGAFQQRIGIYINQSAIINERLALDIGVGGLFWYAYPIVEAAPWSVTTKFGPGITSAQAIYHFGKIEEANAWLQFGFFPLKYNPDAKNLGEYLFRSGVYPAFLWTGGWWTVNNSFYFAQGARFHWNTLGGFLRNDFMMVMERDFAPMGDITPAYIGTVNSGGAWELGAGVAFHHLIPVQPSKTTPGNIRNQRIHVPRQYYLEDAQGNRTYHIQDPANPGQGTPLSFLRTRGGATDTLYEYSGPAVGIDDTYLQKIEKNQPDRIHYTSQGEYTHQGIKLMARGSLDFSKLLGFEGALGREGVKVFAEAAVLGVSNYDYFYKSMAERTPVMFGISSPVPYLFDVLSLQLEYYDNPYANSIEALYQFQRPQPGFRQGSYLNFEPNDDDNWKWSVYASKTIFSNLTLFAQVARDHLRTIDHDAKLAYEDVLASPGDWYYLLRVEFGI